MSKKSKKSYDILNASKVYYTLASGFTTDYWAVPRRTMPHTVLDVLEDESTPSENRTPENMTWLPVFNMMKEATK